MLFRIYAVNIIMSIPIPHFMLDFLYSKLNNHMVKFMRLSLSILHYLRLVLMCNWQFAISFALIDVVNYTLSIS